MDKLPHSVLLHILSRLDDSHDVARCRVAWKAFDTVFPGLRSINLRCSIEWYYISKLRVSNSQRIKPFKTVLLDLISKLETVESVCLSLQKRFVHESDDFNLTDGDFHNEWLPRVSRTLKSLSISNYHCGGPSNVLPLISTYCHNLVNLKLENVWLSLHNLISMPMLTSLTLESVLLDNEQLNELNKSCPNLQVLKLVSVIALKNPMIHLLNLKTCVWDPYDDDAQSLTLIAPNLITLTVEAINLVSVHVEAPMLSHFQLSLNGRDCEHATILSGNMFENLKTLWLDSSYIGSILLQFPITKTVENLTLYSSYGASRDGGDSEFSLKKLFTVFPNVSSLCIKSEALSELEADFKLGWYPDCLNILDGRKGLKTICAYMELADPSLTFSFVASVLDQCVGLLEVSLLFQVDIPDTVFVRFVCKCMNRWPMLKWRLGVWSEGTKDDWITDIRSLLYAEN